MLLFAYYRSHGACAQNDEMATECARSMHMCVSSTCVQIQNHILYACAFICARSQWISCGQIWEPAGGHPPLRTTWTALGPPGLNPHFLEASLVHFCPFWGHLRPPSCHFVGIFGPCWGLLWASEAGFLLSPVLMG